MMYNICLITESTFIFVDTIIYFMYVLKTYVDELMETFLFCNIVSCRYINTQKCKQFGITAIFKKSIFF